MEEPYVGSSQVLHIAGKTVLEWIAIREKMNHVIISSLQPQQYPTQWEKPTEGLCKLNVDAALFSQRGLVASFSCDLRGTTGAFISTRESTVRLNLQPQEAEAECEGGPYLVASQSSMVVTMLKLC